MKATPPSLLTDTSPIPHELLCEQLISYWTERMEQCRPNLRNNNHILTYAMLSEYYKSSSRPHHPLLLLFFFSLFRTIFSLFYFLLTSKFFMGLNLMDSVAWDAMMPEPLPELAPGKSNGFIQSQLIHLSSWIYFKWIHPRSENYTIAFLCQIVNLWMLVLNCRFASITNIFHVLSFSQETGNCWFGLDLLI